MEVNLKDFAQADPEWVKRCRDAKSDVELAEIALECLSALAYMPPPNTPQILLDFERDRQTVDWRNKSAQDKDLIYKKIMGRSEVVKYIEESSKASVTNYGNVTWLEQYMATFLQAGKDVEAKKCWELYNQYPSQIKYGSGIIWKKKTKDFAKPMSFMEASARGLR